MRLPSNRSQHSLCENDYSNSIRGGCCDGNAEHRTVLVGNVCLDEPFRFTRSTETLFQESNSKHRCLL